MLQAIWLLGFHRFLLRPQCDLLTDLRAGTKHLTDVYTGLLIQVQFTVAFWSKFKSTSNNQRGEKLFQIVRSIPCTQEQLQHKSQGGHDDGHQGIRWGLKGAFLPGSKFLERERNNMGMIVYTPSQMCL